jgi:hypothetical protein
MIYTRLFNFVLLALTIIVIGLSDARAYDVGTNYNSANMSYPADSTISQSIVFNSSMKAGGTINFVVDAHAGGGRPLQHDTGQLKIEFYNASNTLLGSAQTTFSSGNLPMMDAWSSGPGDNTAPWMTLSLSTNTCGTVGSCSNVSYMKIIMIGTDTSWWAGNYGPQWRLPTVTFNGGSNLAYNPEFGSYNNTKAQGWESSSGWGACGTTSGSVMCTTQATGVTANASGGGYDPLGGTTSGTAGGYNSTLTISDANAGTGGGASTPSPTAPAYPSYVTVGSGTPGTMTFSDTSTLSNTQQSNVDTWTNRIAQDGNKIYIQQIGGDNNTVTMNQDGNKNLIRARIDGSGNSVMVNQGTPGISQNEIKINTVGDSNSLNINQARTTQGTAIGGNGHYQTADINGSNNTLTTQQSNTGGVGGQYMETTINGNQNSVTARQTDNGNKIMFNTITGNNNTIDAVQKGTGQHYLENKLTGNGNSVSAVQEGNTANRATLDLTNAGGPASVILQQNGGQNVTVITTCATAGGCAPITVRQGY